MRAMWLHYPDDVRAEGIGSQFLWGRDLLVAPVFMKGATSREVYLPKGDWYDWWTHARTTGGRPVTRAVDLATMPLYVRAGAIIPLGQPLGMSLFGSRNGSEAVTAATGPSGDRISSSFPGPASSIGTHA